MVKKLGPCLVVGSLCLAASCGGPTVVLNERLFELPSMKSAGAGCMRFELGGGASTGGGAGFPSLGLLVEHRLAGDRVVVTVSESGRTLDERAYGEAFFRSHEIDEFVATSSSSAQLLLRFWGSTDADLSSCTPLENEGPDPR